jgi:hypothetical protein
MMVLGILLHHAKSAAEITVTEMTQQLARLFPSANCSRNAAHTTLERLEQQGLVRLASKGQERGLDRYAATSAGEDYFSAWFAAPIRGVPRLRDHMHGRVAFLTPELLPGYIESVVKEMEACQQRYEKAHGVASARHKQTRGRRDDFNANLLTIMSADEETAWMLQRQRLRELRKNLEELYRHSREDRLGGG